MKRKTPYFLLIALALIYNIWTIGQEKKVKSIDNTELELPVTKN